MLYMAHLLINMLLFATSYPLLMKFTSPFTSLRFFYFFYWMINAGAFCGQMLTAQLRGTVQCFGGDCFLLPFGILVGIMVLSTIVFYSGERKTSLAGSCLKTGQHSIFVIIRKIINDTRMLDTAN